MKVQVKITIINSLQNKKNIYDTLNTLQSNSAILIKTDQIEIVGVKMLQFKILLNLFSTNRGFLQQLVDFSRTKIPKRNFMCA